MTTNATTRERAMRTLQFWALDSTHTTSDQHLYSNEQNTAVTDLSVDLIMTLPKEQRLTAMQDIANHVLAETAEEWS
jgi:hypothetical protein